MTRPTPAQPTSYFGARPDSLQARYMWVWTGSTLRIQQGKEHGQDLGWDGDDLEKLYRGWFDPQTKELFIVIPPPRPGQPARRVIPRLLDRMLRRKFSEDLVYRAF